MTPFLLLHRKVLPMINSYGVSDILINPLASATYNPNNPLCYRITSHIASIYKQDKVITLNINGYASKQIIAAIDYLSKIAITYWRSPTNVEKSSVYTNITYNSFHEDQVFLYIEINEKIEEYFRLLHEAQGNDIQDRFCIKSPEIIEREELALGTIEKINIPSTQKVIDILLHMKVRGFKYISYTGKQIMSEFKLDEMQQKPCPYDHESIAWMLDAAQKELGDFTWQLDKDDNNYLINTL